MNISEYRKITDRVSEGLSKQAVKEDITIDELNEKIDIIMQALGLEESEEKKEESKTTEKETITTEEETTEEMPEFVEEEEAKEEVIKDSIDYDKTKNYKIQFMDSRAYATDIDKIKDLFTEPNTIYFKDIDEVVEFLINRGIIRYMDVDKLVSEDNIRDKGIIYMTGWYEVVKL